MQQARRYECSLARQIANYIIPPLGNIDLSRYADWWSRSNVISFLEFVNKLPCARTGCPDNKLHVPALAAVTVYVRLLHDFLRTHYVRLRAAKLLLRHCAQRSTCGPHDQLVTHCCAKPNDSICLLVNYADTAFLALHSACWDTCMSCRRVSVAASGMGSL